MAECEHVWIITGRSAWWQRWLILHCQKCGHLGVVKDPTEEEWLGCIECHLHSWIWDEKERVTYLGWT